MFYIMEAREVSQSMGLKSANSDFIVDLKCVYFNRKLSKHIPHRKQRNGLAPFRASICSAIGAATAEKREESARSISSEMHFDMSYDVPYLPLVFGSHDHERPSLVTKHGYEDLRFSNEAPTATTSETPWISLSRILAHRQDSRSVLESCLPA